MLENTHTFTEGETFDGNVADETIVIREVREHTIVWDYIVNGDTIGRNTTEKEKARTFVRCGHWKEPVTA
jgi:hypothetical protein